MEQKENGEEVAFLPAENDIHPIYWRMVTTAVQAPAPVPIAAPVKL
jgi:hypothetical protein